MPNINGGSLVWADFSVYTRSRLYQIGGNLTGSHCLNEIVHSLVTPALRHIVGGNQHDNVQPYQAGMVNDYIQQTYVNRLPWSSNSVYLITIEHLWEELGRRKTGPQPYNAHNKRCTIQFINPRMECYSPKMCKPS